MQPASLWVIYLALILYCRCSLSSIFYSLFSFVNGIGYIQSQLQTTFYFIHPTSPWSISVPVTLHIFSIYFYINVSLSNLSSCPNHRRTASFPLSLNLLLTPYLFLIFSLLPLARDTCSSNMTSPQQPLYLLLYSTHYSSFTTIQCCKYNYSFIQAPFLVPIEIFLFFHTFVSTSFLHVSLLTYILIYMIQFCIYSSIRGKIHLQIPTCIHFFHNFPFRSL